MKWKLRAGGKVCCWIRKQWHRESWQHGSYLEEGKKKQHGKGNIGKSEVCLASPCRFPTIQMSPVWSAPHNWTWPGSWQYVNWPVFWGRGCQWEGREGERKVVYLADSKEGRMKEKGKSMAGYRKIKETEVRYSQQVFAGPLLVKNLARNFKNSQFTFLYLIPFL